MNNGFQQMWVEIINLWNHAFVLLYTDAHSALWDSVWQQCGGGDRETATTGQGHHRQALEGRGHHLGN